MATFENDITDDKMTENQICALEWAQWLVENNTYTENQMTFVKTKMQELPRITTVDDDIYHQLEAMCAQAHLNKNIPEFDELFGF
jgi:hypothetical protein